MRFLLAPDSFKESISATQAAVAMAAGLRLVDPTADYVVCPISDGGEGSAAIVTRALGGVELPLRTVDALGREHWAKLGWVAANNTAIVEVAQAIGLDQIAPAERAVRQASSYGAGQLLQAALELGARRIIVGLGGSASCDGGAGLLQALGVKLTDTAGRELAPGGEALATLERIDDSGLNPAWSKVKLEVACDVTNPLLGPRGAAAVFGPQKGASPADVVQLTAGLTRWAEVVWTTTAVQLADLPRAGAAGGIAGALAAFLPAALVSGIDLVLATCGFADQLALADVVLTGEGQLDAQTSGGKALSGVARLAAAQGKPVVAFVGQIQPGACLTAFQRVIQISPDSSERTSALAQGAANLTKAVANWLTDCRKGNWK